MVSPITVLILCNKDDQVALSLFRQWQNTAEPAALVFAEDLAIAGWKHLISAGGKCSTEIILPNGKIIQSGTLKAVFNRIRYIPMWHFINETDRAYAEMEIFALFTSFLESIQHTLINPLQRSHILPDEDNELLIKKQAVEAGLPVCNYHFTSAPKWQSTKGLAPMDPRKSGSFYKKSPHLVWENQPVLFMETYDKVLKTIVVGENIIGEPPPKYAAEIKMLASITGIFFLEVCLVHTTASYKLGQLNRFPQFAGQPVIDALAGLIEQKIQQKS